MELRRELGELQDDIEALAEFLRRKDRQRRERAIRRARRRGEIKRAIHAITLRMDEMTYSASGSSD